MSAVKFWQPPKDGKFEITILHPWPHTIKTIREEFAQRPYLCNRVTCPVCEALTEEERRVEFMESMKGFWVQ